jgi:hypothetical protein
MFGALPSFYSNRSRSNESQQQQPKPFVLNALNVVLYSKDPDSSHANQSDWVTHSTSWRHNAIAVTFKREGRPACRSFNVKAINVMGIRLGQISTNDD